MKEEFRYYNFDRGSLDKIDKANEVIERYQGEGLRLTARQLYYQFVSQNWITNEEKSYKNLTNLISKARLAGLIDWDAIEDRGRVPERASEFKDLAELARAAVQSYRLPRWDGQDAYCELWVEKQALAGVLSPLARQYHVTLMVNKGYSSQSAMYESAQRFKEACDGGDCTPILFYLGDHDPSGEDMVRDIADRLVMFGVDAIDVRKVALTMAQIRQYNPPPNPAKITDPRARKYIAEHGNHSWEVDALPPNVLAQMIRGSFSAVVDKEKMDKIIAKEESDKKRLIKAVEKLV